MTAEEGHPMTNVRAYLGETAPYSTFNREERNCVAMLYQALLLNGNLQRFLDAIQCKFPLDDSFAIYVEYAYLRDLWFRTTDNETRRGLILDFLKPSDAEQLAAMSVEEFNTYFGATPRPSSDYIQDPGRWSLMRFAPAIADNDEFERTCRFKWSFNIKPDMVIQTSTDQVVCVEAKYDSVEGQYPTRDSELAEFHRRGLSPVLQTALQRHLMGDLLGFESSFVFLVKNPATRSMSHRHVSWREAFERLDISGCPRFIRDWVDALPFIEQEPVEAE